MSENANRQVPCVGLIAGAAWFAGTYVLSDAGYTTAAAWWLFVVGGVVLVLLADRTDKSLPSS